MRIVFYSARPYERTAFEAMNAAGFELCFIEGALDAQSAATLRAGDVVCASVSDDLRGETLAVLRGIGVRLVTLRSAGFDHVDLDRAHALGIAVARVPDYSPASIAEHTLGMMLTLTHRIAEGCARVQRGDLSLAGLEGSTVAGRTVGIVGTGRIGSRVARVLLALDARVIAMDPTVDPSLAHAGVRYVDLASLLHAAEILTLHCPLLPQTRHLIDEGALARMPRGAWLVNTSRGAVVDTHALLSALDSGQLSGVALDVYEYERGLFLSGATTARTGRDRLFDRLVKHPRILVTAHQAFLTREALEEIARTTLASVEAFHRGARPSMDGNVWLSEAKDGLDA